MGARTVSILLVTWNGRELLEACLEALRPQLARFPSGAELWIFDNGSSDGTVAWLERHVPEAHVVASPSNVGFAPAVQELARRAPGDAIVLLNNDAVPAPDWLESLLEAFEQADRDVVGLAGRLYDASGERLDFGRGILTFDGHAFQLDQGRPVSAARLPEPGEELLFACGGNAVFDRRAFLELGGFDPDYFAYLEDVDFGWRAWSRGWRILAGPAEAVAFHRSMASSDRLGLYRRGYLFERNALRTVLKNFDAASRKELLPAVLWTYLSRLEALAAEELPGGTLVRTAPVAGAPDRTVEMERSVSLLERLQRRFAESGVRGFLRASGRRLRSLLRTFGGRSRERIALGPRAVAHFQALASVLAEFERLESREPSGAAERKRPDRVLFERFPLWIVPTYPGDERLFAARAFEAMLPAGWTFERARLEEVLEPPRPDASPR